MRWLSPPDKRAGGAGERQVIEADIDQELEALADLLQDAARRSRSAAAVSVAGRSPNQALALRIDEVADLGDVEPVELHRQRLGLEALAVAGRAGLGGLVALDLLAHPGGVGLLPAPLEIGDHALEGLGRLVGAEAVVVGEGDLLLAGAVEDDVAHLLRQLPPRRVGRELVVAGERLQRLQVIGRRRLAPRRDGVLAERQRVVGDDEGGVDRRARCRGRRRPGRRRRGC